VRKFNHECSHIESSIQFRLRYRLSDAGPIKNPARIYEYIYAQEQNKYRINKNQKLKIIIIIIIGLRSSEFSCSKFNQLKYSLIKF